MLWQLIRKELYLHRSSLLFALAVVVLWGALMSMTPQAERVLATNQLTMGGLISLLQTGAIGLCLLVILPLLIGAALMAEERKLEVWDWQLSLPVARSWQWAMKLAVGATLTLLLVMVVHPILDGLMAKALAGKGDSFPLASQYVRFNPSYFFLPLLVMASATYASSLLKDPYRAFFGGMIVLCLALGCVWMADPAMLLFQPWHPESPEGKLAAIGNVAYLGTSGPILVVSMALVLVGLAWFNFRYEEWRWRRLAAQLATMVLLVGMATAFFVHRDYSPASILSTRAEDVQPLLRAERDQFGLPLPKADWNGIEPLLVVRAPKFRSDFKRNSIPYLRYGPQILFGNIYRAPETGAPKSGLPRIDHLLAEINTFPIGSQRRNLGFYLSNKYQFAEIDPASGRCRLAYQVGGRIMARVPESSAYFILSPSRTDYVVTRWPVPFRVGGILWSLWAGDKNDAYRDLLKFSRFFSKNLAVDGKAIRVESIMTLNSSQRLYQVFYRKDLGFETWLIRRAEDGTFARIDKQKGYMQYVVSSDGKWFSTKIHSEQAYPELTIRSVDQTKAFAIKTSGGNITLAAFTPEDNRMIASNLNLLGKGDLRMMQVSPSGNYLPFLRTRAIKAETPNQVEKDAGFSQWIEIGALDLRNGLEHILMDWPPDQKMREKSPIRTQKWHAGNPPVFRQVFPVMAWAPKTDKLAILYDNWVHLFELQTGSAEHPLRTAKRIDLRGFAINNLDFWDAQTLLAWGRLGLFKIDIKAATRTKRAASVQERRR